MSSTESARSGLNLRRAGVRDVDFLVDLRNALAGGFLSQMPATRAKTLRMLATSETYIINHDGQRIGTFALYDFRQGKADFGRFMVIPGEQGNGVGDWAMQKAIKWAVARGLRRLELLVREDNAVAVDLYTRHGFFPVRRGPGYSVMRKSL